MNKELIEQIVQEVLKRIQQLPEKKEIDNSPKNLVVYTKKREEEVFFSDSLENTWNLFIKGADDKTLPKRVDAVLFLQGSQDLMVKGAIGITDTPEAERLSYHMMQGRTITIVPNEVLKQVIYEDERKVVNKAYQTQLLEYKSKLETLGVTIEPLSDFEKRSALNNKLIDEKSYSFVEKLLTERAVQQHAGETIVISTKTLITPLARDAARKLGKVIHILDSKGAD